MNINTPPAVVLDLSRQVNLTPMEWKVYDHEVVIVFTTGQKMRFEREPELKIKLPKQENKLPKPTAPALSGANKTVKRQVIKTK